MKKNFSLSVASPCSENWVNFTTTPQGGFCASCSKIVVDFTRLSDDDIIAFFKHKPAHTCGRFRADQLKPYTETALVKINPGFTLLKAGLVSLFFLLASKETTAQVSTSKVTTEVHPSENHKQKKDSATETDHIVKGLVIAEDDVQPIAGVNVVLKGTTQGTTTDAEGRFEFPVRLKTNDVLIFGFIGFETQEYTVRENASEEIQISLSLEMMIMGEVAVDGAYKEPHSSLHNLWLKVKNMF